MKKVLSIVLLLALLLSTTAAAATEPTITSKAAFVLDYDTGTILFAQNEDTLLVPASTTKLLTAYLVFEAMEAGQFTEDTLVPVSSHAREVSLDWELTNVPLKSDGRYTVRDLMSAMLVVSACGVCVSLAELVSGSEAAFVQKMNDTMAALGLDGSFTDCYGLSSQNQISARSLGLLSQALIERFPQVLGYTAQTAIQFDGVWYSCTNCLLPGSSAEYEGADGLKTGSTSAAGKCLVGTAKQNGRRIIAVLLGAAYSSVRATEMVALLDYGFALLEEGFILPSIPELPSAPTEPTIPTTPTVPDVPSASVSAEEAAWQLYELGLLRGQGTLPDGSPDLALRETLTRAESVVLLLRLLGQETAAFLSDASAPFIDVPDWAAPYVSHAWQQGLVKGISATEFSPDSDCDVRSYLTLCFRALGYVEGSDFIWEQAVSFAAMLGLHAADGLQPTTTLTRGIAAQLTYGMLFCWMADGSQTLGQSLGLVGSFIGAADAA